MLVVKFDIAAERGVRCTSSLNGMMGSVETYFSTSTKTTPVIRLAIRRPDTSGLDQGNSSEDWRLMPRSKDPTVKRE